MNIGRLQAVPRSGGIGRLLRLLPLVVATSVLLAQTGRGKIEGTVKDPNGANVQAPKFRWSTLRLIVNSISRPMSWVIIWRRTCRWVPTA
jgi:hypothetical protein